MSCPRSSISIIFGMSRGSFWRSPSEVTMMRPRAWSNPAANAAVWPKLRRKRMTRRCGSIACSRARIWKLSSVLPSSTISNSYGRPHAVSVSVSSRWSSTSDSASLRIGMTTLISGAMRVRVMIRDLSSHLSAFRACTLVHTKYPAMAAARRPITAIATRNPFSSTYASACSPYSIARRPSAR